MAEITQRTVPRGKVRERRHDLVEDDDVIIRLAGIVFDTIQLAHHAAFDGTLLSSLRVEAEVESGSREIVVEIERVHDAAADAHDT